MPAPTVISTDPAAGATNVSRYGDVTARFSIPLKYLRHNLAAEPLVMQLEQPAGTVVLSNSGQHVVPITFNYNDVRRQARLRVRVCMKALLPLVTYTAQVSGAVSYDGTGQVSPYSWTFTTEPAAGGAANAPVPGYVCWFHADSLGLTNGASVVQLTDSSANANHALQATPAQRGTFLASAQNGKPAVTFNGVNTNYTTSGLVNTGSFFVVVNHADGGSIFTDYRRVLDAGDTQGWSFFGITGQSYYNPSNLSRNIDASTFRINGVLTLSRIPLSVYRVIYGEMSPVNPVLAAVAAGSYSGSQFLTGNICEYIIYPARLSSTDRQSNESYLMAKYAIS